MKTDTDLELFVSCAPGLERLLATELRALCPNRPVKAEPGGASLRGDVPLLMRLNLECGLATRVLLRVGSFTARSLRKLRRKVSELPWKPLLGKRCRWEIKVFSRDSRLGGTSVVNNINQAIAGVVGTPGDDAAEVSIQMRLESDRCTLSLDTSGEPLHRRGWRLQTAKAPLREDLARGLLAASGWQIDQPLIDPMMGSGTLVIEAALMARRAAPGWLRSFDFEKMALFRADVWQTLRKEAEDRRAQSKAGKIFGRDRAEGALKATRGNAERAGVLADLVLQRADLDEVPLPDIKGGAVVCNPPYGQRIAGAADALQALDRRLAELPGRVRVGLVAPAGTGKGRRTQLRAAHVQPVLMTDHGGSKVVFLIGKTRKGAH